MFFTEKYAEQVASWLVKTAFASKKEGRKLVATKEQRGDSVVVWYGTMYCAYAIPEYLNPIKATECSLFAETNASFIPAHIPQRELRRTDRLEKKSKFTYVVFEDANGRETLVNEKMIALADKYPYAVRYYQEVQNSVVVIADNEDMIALVMPTVKR